MPLIRLFPAEAAIRKAAWRFLRAWWDAAPNRPFEAFKRWQNRGFCPQGRGWLFAFLPLGWCHSRQRRAKVPSCPTTARTETSFDFLRFRPWLYFDTNYAMKNENFDHPSMKEIPPGCRSTAATGRFFLRWNGYQVHRFTWSVDPDYAM